MNWKVLEVPDVVSSGAKSIVSSVILLSSIIISSPPPPPPPPTPPPPPLEGRGVAPETVTDWTLTLSATTTVKVTVDNSAVDVRLTSVLSAPNKEILGPEVSVLLTVILSLA